MDNLWEKETNRNRTTYVDLLAPLLEDEQIRERCNKGLDLDVLRTLAATNQKDNKVSTERRMKGNEIFATKDYFRAMNLYTVSLRYAEVGTENVALAYSNRSACFFNMKRYKEALVDIELAKQANLPDHLVPTLKQRRQNCLKLMDTVRYPPVCGPTLSYESNKDFPCLANVVDIKCNPEFGRHLVANSDIPEGKIILVEENFAESRMDDFSVCYICSASWTNFIACEQCVKVVFCSRECMSQHQSHTLECGTFFGHMSFPDDLKAQRNASRIKLIMHTILKAISTFSKVEELMQFVETTLSEDPDQLPTSLLNQISKYHLFFKLKKRMVRDTEGNLNDVKLLFALTMELPKVCALFDTSEKHRFLTHLIAHHSGVINTNSSGNDASLSIRNMFSLLNHSCDPNLDDHGIGKLKCCMTTRPVKQGEQLFISYLSPTVINLSKEKR